MTNIKVSIELQASLRCSGPYAAPAQKAPTPSKGGASLKVILSDRDTSCLVFLEPTPGAPARVGNSKAYGDFPTLLSGSSTGTSGEADRTRTTLDTHAGGSNIVQRGEPLPLRVSIDKGTPLPLKLSANAAWKGCGGTSAGGEGP